MKEIRCPHCNKVFQVDDSDYASILSHVKEEEVARLVNEKLKEVKELENKQKEVELEKQSSKYEKEINELKNANLLLQAKIDSSDKEQNLKINEVNEENAKKLKEKEMEIINLTNLVNNAENDKKIALQQLEIKKNEEISNKTNKIIELEGEIKNVKTEAQNEKNELTLKYKNELNNKDEEIALYKDKKAKLNVKLIGEDLEQHCMNSFNAVRMQGFQNAYFEKDNDSSNGSKGDFIYRESTPEGAEIISIMFEMKNEAEDSSTKHKNENFYEKLDKDRKAKGCEYAVLVSMLELDNDYFNAGIVDVSYKYEKMFVVRPNCFIPIITLLRNAAYKNIEIKNQLVTLKEQNIDITNFEDKLNVFKEKVDANYQKAKKQFFTAIDEIDATIKHLQKVKESLLSSDNNLRLASERINDLTIRKLTYGNPTMKRMFEEAKEDKE